MWMSALGQKRTCAVQKGMSALPPKADMNASIYDHVGLTVATDNRYFSEVTPLRVGSRWQLL
jgi:hypothetical protein